MSLEKTLVDKTEEKVKLALVDGKIQIVSSYEGKIGGVDLTTYVKTDAMIDFLTGLIPGTWDEVPAAILKEKLKSL